MSWSDWSLPASVLESAATIAAIVIGGGWAIIRFRRRREFLWNVDVTIATPVYKLDDNRVLVTIEVGMKNIGSAVFVPGQPGLQLAIRRIKLPEVGVVPEWEQCEVVVEPVDILEKYLVDASAGYRGEYALDVDSTYTETFSVVLESGHFYLVKSALKEIETGFPITNYTVVDARASSGAKRPG